MQEPSAAPPRSVLFVCLGNICRSPLAQGVLEHLIAENGGGDEVVVDSAGTGAWHVGEPPDPRSVEVAERNGVTLRCRGRQVTEEDFFDFDLVLAMDRSNLEHLAEMRNRAADRGGTVADLRLFREFDPEAEEDLEVPDPYFGDGDGFDVVYAMVLRGCRELVREMKLERV